MPAPEIAVAYVSIVPEVQGFARQLRNQLVGDADNAGGDAGNRAARSFTSSFRRALEREAPSDAFVKMVSVGANAARLYAAGAGAAIGLALANSAASAAAGVGVTMQAIRPQIDSVTEASEAYNKVQDAQAKADQKAAIAKRLAAKGGKEYEEALQEAESAAKAAKDAQDEYKLILSQMPPETAKAAKAFIGLREDTQKWSDSLAPHTMPLFTAAINKIRSLLPALTPIVKDVTREIKDFAASIPGSQTSEVFSTFANNIKNNAGSSLRTFLEIGKNVATGVLGIVNAFQGLQSTGENTFLKLSQRFAQFGANLGKSEKFHQFIAQVKQALPQIGQFLGDLFMTIGKIAVAAAGLGPIFFGTFGLLLRLTAALPIGVIRALIVAYVGWKAAVIAHSAAQKIHWLWTQRSTLATIRQRAAVVLTTIAMRAARLAILAGAAAMRVFNLVMRMNPIGLVITALFALGAALVVAYKRSSTFRAIVQGALHAVGAAGKWLWNNALKPAFNFMRGSLRVLGSVFKWLYANAVKPAFHGIAAAGRWLYAKALKPSFDFISRTIRNGGAVARWLYNRAIRPAFHGIAAVAKWLYNKGIRPALNSSNSAMRGVARVARWLWEKGVKTPFRLLREGVAAVARGFRSAKDSIARQWSKVSSIAKKPVSFVINTVYNRGIVGVWNKVASAFGAPKLKAFHPRGFARGGILPGYTPGRDVHRFFSPTGGMLDLSGGESIFRPEFTRAVGPSFVHTMNRIARTRGVAGVRRALGTHSAFADGGIFGWIDKNVLGGFGSKAWEKVKAGARWIKDTLEGSARAGVKRIVNPLLSRIPGLNTGFGRMIKRIPMKIVDAIFGYAKKADRKLVPHVKYNPTKGVEQWRPVVLRALREVGQPASLANTTLRRMQQESGGNPRAVNRWDINWKLGHPSVGLMQVIGPTFRAYAGKYRNRGPFMYGVSIDPLANIYASMRYALSRYGSLSRAYNRPGGYDSGGWLRPGITTVLNGMRKPEAVLTPTQWANISTLAERGAGGLQPGDRLVLVTDGGSFEAYVDRRADERIKAGLVDPVALGRSL